MNYQTSNNPKLKAVLSIRAMFLSTVRQWLAANGFVEVQGPIIVPRFGDTPGPLEILYYDNKAALCGGLQPYTNVFTDLFEKVYAIQPAFRTELSTSNRHLTEFWRIELAASTLLFEDMLGIIEKFVIDTTNMLTKHALKDLKTLERDVGQLCLVKDTLPRLSYDAAIEQLQRDGAQIEWGANIDSELEQKLSDSFKVPFFITNFPANAETQYFESPAGRPELSLTADLVAPDGYGELGSGGQTLKGSDILKTMREDQMNAAVERWYGDLKSAESRVSTFAVGIERYLQWFCGLSTIAETVAFPRSPNVFYP